MMIWTTACREGKGVRITWWRHDRRPAAGGRHLLALGALGSLPSRRTKVPTTGKRHTVPLHLSHLSQLSHCVIALVTLVTLGHCTSHTAPTWQEIISPFSAEGTIVNTQLWSQLWNLGFSASFWSVNVKKVCVDLDNDMAYIGQLPSIRTKYALFKIVFLKPVWRCNPRSECTAHTPDVWKRLRPANLIQIKQIETISIFAWIEFWFWINELLK